MAGPYLVKKRVMLAGDVLSDARVSIGQFNEPYVSVTFDAKEAREFDRITGENVKKRMAIVLDNTIYSAPVIQSASAADAQITGTFSMEEANNLSIVLRAGALPAPLKIIQDSPLVPRSAGLDRKRRQGDAFAGPRGRCLWRCITAVWVIANFALMLNLICLIGFLAALNATRPAWYRRHHSDDWHGRRFQRADFRAYREELRQEKAVRVAMMPGYDKALVDDRRFARHDVDHGFALFCSAPGRSKGLP